MFRMWVWLLVTIIGLVAGGLVAVPALAAPTDSPTLLSVTVTPDFLMRGFFMGTKGEVTLSGPAPKTGIIVNIAGDSQLGLPNGVKVKPGDSKAQFDVWEKTSDSTSRQFSTAEVRATLGSTMKTVRIQLRPFIVNLKLDPVEIYGGQAVTGTVTVGIFAAPAAGQAPPMVPTAVPSNVTVNLSSDNAKVTVPSAISVDKGSSSATFTAETRGVALPVRAKIKALAKGMETVAGVALGATTIKAVSLETAEVTGSGIVNATVTLHGKAPEGGYTLSPSVSSTHPQSRVVASAPDQVMIPADATTGSFQVATRETDTQVTVSVRVGGSDGTATRHWTVRFTLKPAPPR